MKTAARLVLRTNWSTCLIVSLITSALIWPILSVSAVMTASNDALVRIFQLLHLSGAEHSLSQLRDWLAELRRLTSVGQDSSAGVISTLYNSVKTSGSVEKAVLTAISRDIFHHSLGSSLIAVVAALMSLALLVFVRIPLRISALRFYLETRIYLDTTLSRLLFVFRHRRTLAIAWAGFYKLIWLALWSLTLVMLPVKFYSYRMYDYILAENPRAGARQALKLSQELMRGKRWRVFLLDLSFAGWYLLGLLSFGVAIYFYATPYHQLALAEFYVRARSRARDLPGFELCDDQDLVELPGDESLLTYPDPNQPGEQSIFRVDYRRDYAPINLVLLFFCFSFIGWVYESLLSPAYTGHFVNKGTLYGPWLPIYGSGGVVVLVILKKLRDKPWATFGAAVVICGLIEYVTATLIQHLRGVSYWSYNGFFFNIQGRVCLEGLLVFGIACSAVVYFLAPLIDTWLRRIPPKIRLVILAALTTAFLADVAIAVVFPRLGSGLTA